MNYLIPTVNVVPPWLQPKQTKGRDLSRSADVVRGPAAVLMGANPDLTSEQAQSLLRLQQASKR